MLERHGAASIVAVEGNRGAYLKCLITKELLALERSRFLCGDFLAYLQATSDTYDVCFASGVLYHVQNPVELIALIAARAELLFIWTHYYDEANVPTRGGRPRVIPAEPAEYRGFAHRRYRYRYGLSLLWRGFCGGSAPFAHWLTREDLLGALEHFGWTSIRIGFDEPQHPNGPALALVARRGWSPAAQPAQPPQARSPVLYRRLQTTSSVLGPSPAMAVSISSTGNSSAPRMAPARWLRWQIPDTARHHKRMTRDLESIGVFIRKNIGTRSIVSNPLALRASLISESERLT